MRGRGIDDLRVLIPRKSRGVAGFDGSSRSAMASNTEHEQRLLLEGQVGARTDIDVGTDARGHRRVIKVVGTSSGRRGWRLTAKLTA